MHNDVVLGKCIHICTFDFVYGLNVCGVLDGEKVSNVKYCNILLHINEEKKIERIYGFIYSKSLSLAFSFIFFYRLLQPTYMLKDKHTITFMRKN